MSMIGHNGAPADPKNPLYELFLEMAHQSQIYYECHEGKGAINSQADANLIKKQIRGMTKQQLEKALIGLVNIHNNERLKMKKYNKENGLTDTGQIGIVDRPFV